MWERVSTWSDTNRLRACLSRMLLPCSGWWSTLLQAPGASAGLPNSQKVVVHLHTSPTLAALCSCVTDSITIGTKRLLYKWDTCFRDEADLCLKPSSSP